MCYLVAPVHLRIVFAFILCATLWGCASSRWQATRDADTAEGYRAFLRDHPNDHHAEDARILLSEREFEAARNRHSVLAYKRFLADFPEAPDAPAARALLEGLRFNAAKDEGTAQAWRLFLRDHPDGAHRDEADRALAEAEFRDAEGGAASEALTRLVRAHPDDPRRLELQKRGDDEAFAAAKKAGAFELFRYLREHPAGAHREAAQAALLGLRLQSLLFSGLVERARGELGASPLRPRLEEAQTWMAAAERATAIRRSTDPLVRTAWIGHYLRSVSDLEAALNAPDPLDRWQAAEELGQHLTVDAIDPLLRAFRTARNPLIRQHAFDSLRRIFSGLPPHLADYELASRVETLRETGASAETWLALAVLWDLSGRLEDAAREYQRAWDVGLPDPVILKRWVEIRKQRRQPFSAAVAARQLALWASSVAREITVPGGAVQVPTSDVRALCAAAVNVRFARQAIEAAKSAPTEFPDDLDRFEIDAVEASRLVEARLKDAELALRAQNANARTCDDRRVAERVQAAFEERTKSLRRLAERSGSAAPAVLAAVRDTDPSVEVRALATSLLGVQAEAGGQ